MEYLSRCENKNFTLYNDMVYNQYLTVKIGELKKGVDYDFHPDDSVAFYPSGALIKSKVGHEIDIMFVTNDGETLFHIVEKELNEMENRIYDIHAHVCSSGVLVAYDYFDHSHDYDYYTYLGTTMTDPNLNNLIKKVENYEHKLGNFCNPAVETQGHNAAAKFLFECTGFTPTDNPELEI